MQYQRDLFRAISLKDRQKIPIKTSYFYENNEITI